MSGDITSAIINGAAQGHLIGTSRANAQNAADWSNAYNQLVAKYNDLMGRFNAKNKEAYDLNQKNASLTKTLAEVRATRDEYVGRVNELIDKAAFMREHEAVKAEMISEKQADFKRSLDEIVSTGTGLDGVLSYIEEQDAYPLNISDDVVATSRLEAVQLKVILAQDKMDGITQKINKLGLEMQAVYDAADPTRYNKVSHNLNFYKQKIDTHRGYIKDIENLKATLDGQVEIKGLIGFRRYLYNYTDNGASVKTMEFKKQKELDKFVDEKRVELEKVLKAQADDKHSLNDYISMRDSAQVQCDQYFLDIKPASKFREKIKDLEPQLAKAKEDASAAMASFKQAVNLADKYGMLNDISRWKALVS